MLNVAVPSINQEKRELALGKMALGDSLNYCIRQYSKL